MGAIESRYQNDLAYWVMALKKAHHDILCSQSRLQEDTLQELYDTQARQLEKLTECANMVALLLSQKAKSEFEQWLFEHSHPQRIRA